ncbi:MAG: hypothetical protein IJO51_02875 [Clostridia bacterium]|nr:hypothetical protein [Clostridia bacterium]
MKKHWFSFPYMLWYMLSLLRYHRWNGTSVEQTENDDLSIMVYCLAFIFVFMIPVKYLGPVMFWLFSKIIPFGFLQKLLVWGMIYLYGVWIAAWFYKTAEHKGWK